VRAALTTFHQAIVAAKMRRIRRELVLHAGFVGSHDEWSQSKGGEVPAPDSGLRNFPQTPLILGEKWDS
jgi:hypothetical protein